jgi:hypothetical protein
VSNSRFEANAVHGIAIDIGNIDVSINANHTNGNLGYGIVALAENGTAVRVTVGGHTAHNNGTGGVSAIGTGTGVVRFDLAASTVSRNGGDGVAAATVGASAGAYLTVTSNIITENTNNGILAVGTTAFAVAAGNTVSRHNTGVTGISGGAVYSAGNSYLFNVTQIGPGPR